MLIGYDFFRALQRQCFNMWLVLSEDTMHLVSMEEESSLLLHALYSTKIMIFTL